MDEDSIGSKEKNASLIRKTTSQGYSSMLRWHRFYGVGALSLERQEKS